MMRALILILLLLQAPFAAPAQTAVNPDARIVSDFEKLVADYMKIHRDAQKQLPLKATDDSARISHREKKFAAAIRAQRPNAAQGDLFPAPIAAEFRRLAAMTMSGPDATGILKSLRRAEPVKTPLAVNQPWPHGVPLQSMPPTLLQNLPQLPPELDYRIVGRALVLRDAAANLILDFFADFLPPAEASTSRNGGSPPPPSAPAPASPSSGLQLPGQAKSVKFAVIGDSGTGEAPQYEIAKLMTRYREKFPFDFVVMLGDNIYGGKSPDDLRRKFDLPYQPLLDAGVKFYASLGNHDDPATETLYKPMNMNGKRYYKFSSGNADFFALDSDYMDPAQLNWLEGQLRDSHADWKICFFHHPLYSHAKYHGSDVDLRTQLEPLFRKYGVNLVLNGHEHVYERIKPMGGVQYFVLGSSGQLRLHDLQKSPDTAKGFDEDQAFLFMEIAGDDLWFQTISRHANTVDSGSISRIQAKPAAKAASAQ